MKSSYDLSLAFQYKKQVASRLVPVTGERIGELVPDSDLYFISEKLDGFLCLAVCDGKSTRFFDQNGTELELSHLADAFPAKAVGMWAGELYVSNGRSRSFLVASALSKDPSALSLAIFDQIGAEAETIVDRHTSIQKFFPKSGVIHAVAVEQVNSRKSIQERFNSVVKAGGEGLVVHTPGGLGYKIKPLQSIDCVVLGYAVRENRPQIRELLLGLVTEEGYRIIGKVSNGFSEADRSEWLTRLDPMRVDSATLEIAGNGLAFHWVKPEIVVEVSCQEVMYETSSGAIRKTELSFSKKGYATGKPAPSFSLIHPVFVQVRADKKPNSDHCGFSQIGLPEKQISQSIGDSVKTEAAVCIERQVYVKSGKGGKALRKFTIWKTPKGDTSRSPFLIYFTDFSAGRKEPLQTELYVARSDDSARAKLNALLEENIKKGWEKVG
jgi:ATP-dependent DNA ligase